MGSTRLFAARGFDLVIGVGNVFSNDVTDVARAYPNVRFACVDYGPPESGPPPNVSGVVFREEHGSFLVGAVAPVAKATGAPVYCPKIEVPVLADIMSYVPWPGFGPFESYDADETVEGGERLALAGFDIDVLFVPGHSPGHVAYSIADEQALFSGDVLFQGSVGRVDLPGGDGPTLLRSIQGLIEAHSPETTVYPGHMGTTTLGAERATNPFLAQLPS